MFDKTFCSSVFTYLIYIIRRGLQPFHIGPPSYIIVSNGDDHCRIFLKFSKTYPFVPLRGPNQHIRMPQVKDRKVSITQRAQAMALLEYGVHINEVATISKLSAQTLYNMRKRLRERGYNPEVNTAFEDRFFKDAPRSGRPIDPNSRRTLKKLAKEKQNANLPPIEATPVKDTPPISQETDIDPDLTISAPLSTVPTSGVNYRPAPYRKDLNPKARQDFKHKIPPRAISAGTGWMVPIEPQQPAFSNKIPIPRLQPMTPGIIQSDEAPSDQTRGDGG